LVIDPLSFHRAATMTPPLAPLTLAEAANDDALLSRFLDPMAAKGLELYAEQEEAILELLAGRNVILNTPTGSGKSLVAAAAHFFALSRGKRSVYTCPIKALVNEKFLALCRDFGPERVGMMTGDATVNPSAPILCCTAEILANQALARGDEAALAVVIMDEFHYYSDLERGVAWQVPLLALARSRFLLMSATLGDTKAIEREVERRTGTPVAVIRSDRRPVPLNFEWSETPLAERVEQLLLERRVPAYLVHFTQRAAAETAQNLMSLAICSKEEKVTLATALEGARFTSPYGKELKRWLRHGIGVHHAGLLPRYRILVEQLAQKGLLKVICGTDTLGVGINVPLRTVVFTQLWKYGGQKAATLSVRDFRQIAGRAGRKGFDDVGHVVVQAPEWVIENLRAEQKAAVDPSKKKKLVKQSAPEGAIGWDRKTLERLQTASPEPLVSRFQVTHGMLLQVLARDADGCREMRRLIADSHETEAKKKTHRRRAWQLFRALLERGIVSIIPRQPSGRRLQVNVALQDDFSLHQTLSIYLIDTLQKLDRESPDYALDVLTLCEAIVEDTEVILRAQVSRAKGDEINRLKAEGVPYEERMEKIEHIEHPKPLREFLYETFNAFSAAHPWVGQENVRPKSIAREMHERFLGFSDYIRDYGLERAEGLLLRHLMQVWKVLAQTVPQSAKTEPVLELETHLEELVRGIDSSLLDEWAQLHSPATGSRPTSESMIYQTVARQPSGSTGFQPASAPDSTASEKKFGSGPRDITRDPAALRRAVRVAIHLVLQDVAARDFEAAAARVLPDEASDELVVSEAKRLEKLFAAYAAARERFRLDPAGRAAEHTHFDEAEPGADEWRIAQVLVDPAEQNDWESRFVLALAQTRATGRVALRLDTVAGVGAP
jgi:superfamily II RNA helicase